MVSENKFGIGGFDAVAQENVEDILEYVREKREGVAEGTLGGEKALKEVERELEAVLEVETSSQD